MAESRFAAGTPRAVPRLYALTPGATIVEESDRGRARE
jgi:hypothetical protein